MVLVSSVPPPNAQSAPTPREDPGRTIRAARHEDVPAVVAGVAELLVEIGGKPAPAEQLEAAAHALIDHPDAGVVLVAECDGLLVGVLGVSWQSAIRVPGSYGIVQELWVKSAYRYREIGAELMSALVELCVQRGIARLEVGLPSERYGHLAATEAFYRNNGFEGIGLRMRRIL